MGEWVGMGHGTWYGKGGRKVEWWRAVVVCAGGVGACVARGSGEVYLGGERNPADEARAALLGRVGVHELQQHERRLLAGQL